MTSSRRWSTPARPAAATVTTKHTRSTMLPNHLNYAFMIWREEWSMRLCGLRLEDSRGFVCMWCDYRLTKQCCDTWTQVNRKRCIGKNGLQAVSETNALSHAGLKPSLATRGRNFRTIRILTPPDLTKGHNSLRDQLVSAMIVRCQGLQVSDGKPDSTAEASGRHKLNHAREAKAQSRLLR